VTIGTAPAAAPLTSTVRHVRRLAASITLVNIYERRRRRPLPACRAQAGRPASLHCITSSSSSSVAATTASPSPRRTVCVCVCVWSNHRSSTHIHTCQPATNTDLQRPISTLIGESVGDARVFFRGGRGCGNEVYGGVPKHFTSMRLRVWRLRRRKII